jgi:hypothetical protein|tara:strand:+ start:373 stop:546 length:174 start_codon:yes stop_codon:yes gene_type:complete
MNDKEKLRMAKNLVKSNNKKIKKALDYINNVLDEREMDNKREYDITCIKEILEEDKK